MKQLKVIISLFFVIFIFGESLAGKFPDYDDIYDVILTGDKDKAYTLLLAYQKRKPDFANTYFQLALIAEDWAKDFNPFTEYYYAKQFIYNTKLYYSLAKLKLADEKKKNRKYYINAGIAKGERKFKLEDILVFIDTQTESIKVYEKNINLIINNYNKSSDAYNKCVDIFMNINTEYSKIKNIYLADNEDINNKLKQLEQSFDSTLVYFDLFKSALKKYPLEGYDQEYKLKQIVTYRLDGLTNTNFLNKQIILWDYKTWIEDLKKTKNERIKNNVSDIVRIENQIQNEIKQLETERYFEKNKEFKLQDKFVYKIEKFDNNSLLIKLFKFNEAKLNYFKFFRNSINNPITLNKFSLEKNATYLHNLLEKQQKADSLNNIFNNSIKASEVRKYNKFYMSKYKGVQGLKDYSIRQDIFFKQKKKDAKETIKKRLFNTVFQPYSNVLTYKTEQIIVKKNFPDLSLSGNDTYNVCDFKKTKTNKLWFSGYYKTKSNKIQSFIANSDGLYEVNILKLGNISEKSNCVNLLIDAYSEGAYTIETEISEEEIKNVLIEYDNKGKLIMKKELPFSKIPRFMAYDDINNSMIIIFYGTNINALAEADNEQLIYYLDFENNTNTYTISFTAKAYVFDIIKLNNNILVFSNFVNYKDTNNKNQLSDTGNFSNKTNVLITLISNREIKKQVAIKNKKSIFGTKAIKINSNLINILGYKADYINRKFERLKKEKLYNIYIDSNLGQIKK